MILVTGAAGTVGSKVIERLASTTKKVIAIDNDLQACEKLSSHFSSRDLIKIVHDDICNASIDKYFDGVSEIIHLAASKDIVNCESLVTEAIRTNIEGTRNILDAAIKYVVPTLVFSSTDKAANPTSVLGMSKFLAERLVAEYSQKYSKKYYSIRFGNILGSSGSIVPLVIEKIKNGQPITVTDVKMTRFVMTLDDAVDTLFNTVEQANGGDIFIKKMASVKIIDLIKAIVEKHKESGQFNYKIIGPRKAEKIHEELIGSEEISLTVESSDFWIITKPSSSLHRRCTSHPLSSDINLLSLEDVRQLVEGIC